MASEELTAPRRDSRLRAVGFWLLDRIWPTLEPPVASPSRDDENALPEIDPSADETFLRQAYERLRDEMSAEADRRRAVEAKLVAVGAVAPIAVTIMAAMATFL